MLGMSSVPNVGHGVGRTQEIPAAFTAETGWPGEEDCAIVTSITTMSEWPIQFRRLHNVRKGIVSAVSVGDGWPKFIADHNLATGAFLTFEVVDSRRLVAALHHRSARDDFAQPQLPDVCTGLSRDTFPLNPSDAGDNHPRQSLRLPDVQRNDCPNFRKTLRKSHTKKQDSSRIVSANPLVLVVGTQFVHFRVFVTLVQLDL